jgi:hypothetical protein
MFVKWVDNFYVVKDTTYKLELKFLFPHLVLSIGFLVTWKMVKYMLIIKYYDEMKVYPKR